MFVLTCIAVDGRHRLQLLAIDNEQWMTQLVSLVSVGCRAVDGRRSHSLFQLVIEQWMANLTSQLYWSKWMAGEAQLVSGGYSCRGDTELHSF